MINATKEIALRQSCGRRKLILNNYYAFCRPGWRAEQQTGKESETLLFSKSRNTHTGVTSPRGSTGNPDEWVPSSRRVSLSKNTHVVPKHIPQSVVLSKFLCSLILETQPCFIDECQYMASLCALTETQEWQSTPYLPTGTSSFAQSVLLFLCFDHLYQLLVDFQISTSLTNRTPITSNFLSHSCKERN